VRKRGREGGSGWKGRWNEKEGGRQEKERIAREVREIGYATQDAAASGTLAAGKLPAMYFLMAASEEPLRSLRPSRAALISSEYFGPSVFVGFLAGGIVICAQKRRCVGSVQAGSGPNSRDTGR